jgi:hypothetical protein
MNFPQDIILEHGFRDKIDPLLVVYDIIHYYVSIILVGAFHQLIRECIFGIFYKEVRLPICSYLDKGKY